MKTLKAISTVAILALALSGSAYAGEISSPGSPVAGEMGTPGVTSSDTEASSVPGDTGFPPALSDVLLALVSFL